MLNLTLICLSPNEITQARTNPLYASMVLAWSMTEVVRYTFYASSLIGQPPYLLTYLRYTMFYILYPIGAGSEAFLTYSTLPNSSPNPIPSWRSFVWGIWTIGDYVRGIMFLVWWPGERQKLDFHRWHSTAI